MVIGYVPHVGDIAIIDFDPQAGHEQGKRRPALVLTDQRYNRASGLTIVCLSLVNANPIRSRCQLNSTKSKEQS